MKIHLRMPEFLKSYFSEELVSFKHKQDSGDLVSAWGHLERAHIIGQKYPFEHTFVHWKMLRFGIRIKNRKEILGQLPRLIFGGIKSFVGHVPIGNPGGANVPPLKSFELKGDLKELLQPTYK